MSFSHNLDIASSVAASSASLWQGTSAYYRKATKQPAKPIKLYEFENCPYCRMVRMALNELHINAEIYPCPKGGKQWREKAIAKGGKAQFPFLVDENTDTAIYESKDIVHYLFNTYLGEVPKKWQDTGFKTLLAASHACSGVRLGKGTTAKPNKQPEKLLTLYAFESSPFARPVREKLCELEIPYKLVTLAKEQQADMGPANRSWNFKPYKPAKGSKREAMQAELGHIASPYLIDPNTNTKMPESKAILEYLDATYGK